MPNSKCLLSRRCVLCKYLQPHALTFPLLFLSFEEQFLKLLFGEKSTQVPLLSPPSTAMQEQPVPPCSLWMGVILLLGQTLFGLKVSIIHKVTRCVRTTVPQGIALTFMKTDSACKQRLTLEPSLCVDLPHRPFPIFFSLLADPRPVSGQ